MFSQNSNEEMDEQIIDDGFLGMKHWFIRFIINSAVVILLVGLIYLLVWHIKNYGWSAWFVNLSIAQNNEVCKN